MVKLKKVINKYKYDRVADNPNNIVVKGHRKFHPMGLKHATACQSFEGYVLGDYLYISDNGYHWGGSGMSLETTYYRYFIGEIRGCHYRADDICYYIWYRRF